MVKLNSTKFWDRTLSNEYNRIANSGIYKSKVSRILSLIPNKKVRILDVGFGYGLIDNLISNQKENVNLYGVDKSLSFHKSLDARIRKKFVKADARKLPFDSNFFDYVLLLDIVEHFTKKDAVKCISEANRVLKKGGKVIISIPLNETSQDYRNNHHLQRFTKESFVDLVIKCGFDVDKLYFYSSFEKFFMLKWLISHFYNKWDHNLLIALCTK